MKAEQMSFTKAQNETKVLFLVSRRKASKICNATIPGLLNR